MCLAAEINIVTHIHCLQRGGGQGMGRLSLANAYEIHGNAYEIHGNRVPEATKVGEGGIPITPLVNM